MILAIIDAFYDSKNNHELCAEVTKITLNDNSKPKNIIQYSLSSINSLTNLIHAIKTAIPVELNNLYVSMDSCGLNRGVKDELEQCGYNILPLKIMGQNLIMCKDNKVNIKRSEWFE